MSVSNGQDANATTFNTAFMSRTTDTSTTGEVGLLDPDSGTSGATVTNAQRQHNAAGSFTGSGVNGTPTQLPSWGDNSVGAASDTLKDRAEALTTATAARVEGPGSSTDNGIVRYDGTTGKLVQDSGITIDDSDNMIVAGDLTVNGTTTTINTATLDVADQNITVNDGGNDVSAEGAGLTIERAGTDGSFIYEDALASKFKLGSLGSEIEVADVSSAQAITNKDVDGGTAANTRRITVPQDTKANLDALTRKEGTIVWANDEDILYADNGSALVAVAASGTGGGGRVIPSWNPADAGGPLEDFEFDEKIWLFNETDAGNQTLVVYMRVPDAYTPGTQIELEAVMYSPSAANTILLSATTTLVRANTDAIDSTTNQHSSTNSALTNTVANMYRTTSVDLTDSSGDVNSVAVSGGDLLKVELVRGTDTDTADIRFVPSATEVSF